LSNDTEDEDAFGWKSNPGEQPRDCITVGACDGSAIRMIIKILFSTKTGYHICE
jgi:hypothetical protein